MLAITKIGTGSLWTGCQPGTAGHRICGFGNIKKPKICRIMVCTWLKGRVSLLNVKESTLCLQLSLVIVITIVTLAKLSCAPPVPPALPRTSASRPQDALEGPGCRADPPRAAAPAPAPCTLSPSLSAMLCRSVTGCMLMSEVP